MDYDQLIYELYRIREKTTDLDTKNEINELRWDVMNNGIDRLVDKWTAQQAIEEYGKDFELIKMNQLEEEIEKEF
ncbi:hypothetical protein JMJ06_000190 [Enterococcus faecalis]|nr:hypothetical protein [Enterococcus faecalis]